MCDWKFPEGERRRDGPESTPPRGTWGAHPPGSEDAAAPSRGRSAGLQELGGGQAVPGVVGAEPGGTQVRSWRSEQEGAAGPWDGSRRWVEASPGRAGVNAEEDWLVWARRCAASARWSPLRALGIDLSLSRISMGCFSKFFLKIIWKIINNIKYCSATVN